MKTRSSQRLLVYAIFFLLALVLSPGARAQQPSSQSLSSERDRGLELYQKGDYPAAIETLRAVTSKNREDGAAWHLLGLALLAAGKKEQARTAFEKAVTVRLHSLIAVPLLMVTTSAPGPAVKPQDRYQAALESAEQYLALGRVTEDWQFQVEALRFYRDYYAGTLSNETMVTNKEVQTRLRISSKPAPDFSGVGASGTSVLRAVFSADGRVRHVLVLKRVAPDFDLRCIEAAQQIKFTPAIKEGKPVSMILQLEYNRHYF
ncbi:MAG: tetratricopeptide repeat protein [Acidobacteriota bacterium]